MPNNTAVAAAHCRWGGGDIMMKRWRRLALVGNGLQSCMKLKRGLRRGATTLVEENGDGSAHQAKETTATEGEGGTTS
jgi:hypothetical protein